MFPEWDTLAILLGFALITAGAWLQFGTGWGLILGGIGVIVFAYLASAPKPKNGNPDTTARGPGEPQP